MCSALNMIVYKKTLNYSLSQSREFDIGNLINFVQVDTEKLIDCSFYISMIVSFPFQIGISIAILFHQIGYSFCFGLVAMLVIFIANTLIAIQINTYQTKQLAEKDQRMKITDEFINGIKIIKLNRWNGFFINRIGAIRGQELQYTYKMGIYVAMIITTVYSIVPLIQGTTLTFYTVLGNQLELSQVITILSTFNIMIDPLISIPYGIGYMLETYVSVHRVQKFLKQDEIHLDHIHPQSSDQYALRILDGHFQWKKQFKQTQSSQTQSKDKTKTKNKNKNKNNDNDSNIDDGLSLQNQKGQDLKEKLLKDGDENESENQTEEEGFSLKNINIEIKKGTVVGIIGKIGSGKSSLLQAIFGEMGAKDKETKVIIDGEISYVPQKSWSISASIEENIRFYDKDKQMDDVQDSVKYSQMEKDLELFKKGLSTVIGDNGINLSGGQKARLNLARAIYQDKEIVLMDDPLSALDLKVGEKVIKEAILGRLTGKTVVVVTHALNYLHYFDQIYYLEDGQIALQGSYQEVSQDERIKQLIQKYKSSVEQLKSNFDNQNKEETSEIHKLIKMQSQESIEQDIIIDEDKEKGSVSIELYKKYILKDIGLPSLIAVFMAISLTISSEYFSDYWITFWVQDKFEQTNSFYISIYFTLAGLLILLVFLRVYILCVSHIKVSSKMHNQILSRLSVASLNEFFDRVPGGRILNRLSKDLQVLDIDLYTCCGSTIICVTRFLFTLGLFLAFTNLYYLIFLVVFLGSMFYMWHIFMKSYREVVRLESISKSPICTFYKESCNGLTSIRAYQKQQSSTKQFLSYLQVNRNNKYLEFGMMKWFILRLQMLTVIISTFSQVVIIFFYSGNPGIAGLLFQYSQLLDVDTFYMINNIVYFESKFVSYERLNQFTKIEAEQGYKYEGLYEDQQLGEEWPQKGEIELDRVSVKYRQDLPLVLQNISFKIEGGQKIGIVGRTGAGKSTLINVFFRILEPLQGSVLVDGIDIRSIQLDKVRSCFTLISQDPYLFQGTLYQNLDPLQKNNKKDIEQLLDRLEINDCLNLKLDDTISKDGQNLSAGQKQLICIIRCVVYKSKIILIDEATANIDVKTEKQIQNIIQSEFKECTILTIAHRINTLNNSDKILVINKGQIQEFDTPSALINNKNSFFRQLCEQLETNQ